MKTCTKCLVEKPLECFNIDSSRKSGLTYLCKECNKLHRKDYKKTKKGKIRLLYNTQLASSKRRGYGFPEYSLNELEEYLMTYDLYHELFNKWKKLGYKKELAPSIDRINDYKGYSFDNIQLVTWKENREKLYKDVKEGVNNKKSKGVMQYSKEGEFIREYYSVRQALRLTKVCYSSICACCNGKRKTAGGYKWKFKK